MNYLKTFLIVLSVLISVVIFTTSLNLGLMDWVKPAIVAIDNKTFHESQSYNDNMIRDLYDSQLAYASGNIVTKTIIKAKIQHEFGAYDAAKVPSDLQPFLLEMKK